jgi:hypothetical protein
MNARLTRYATRVPANRQLNGILRTEGRAALYLDRYQR